MKRYLVYTKLRSGELKYSTSLEAENLEEAIKQNKKDNCGNYYIVVEKKD